MRLVRAQGMPATPFAACGDDCTYSRMAVDFHSIQVVYYWPRSLLSGSLPELWYSLFEKDT